MNPLLFILMLVISFIAVNIGAVAFELTGLDRSMARFQALSCFTGTGFTTREAELITGYPRRRRIASVLMVLGNAGLVALIATFANSVRPGAIVSKLPAFLHIPDQAVPWVSLLVIVFASMLIYRLFSSTQFSRSLTNYLRRSMSRGGLVRTVTCEELMVYTGGYGVASLEIHREGPALNKPLSESGLRGKGITVLVLEREGELTPNPGAETRIRIGDRLVCFGKLDTIRQELLSD
ncbi:cation:proton antiporter regulatory subunit [Verrucomicrobiota bacterium]